MEKGVVTELDERSREIFRAIVESYLLTGEPAGSRNVSRILPRPLSPASVRNVMSDLEAAGLLFAPHTSAGRLPTQQGLRFFVDALLETGNLSEAERKTIDAQVKLASVGKTAEEVLAETSTMLSGLSRSAAVVLASKSAKRLKHIEFVRLSAVQALVVLVGDDGSVENRLLDLPPGLPASALVEASNFLNARVKGRTIADLRAEAEAMRGALAREVDTLTAKLVEAGIADLTGAKDDAHLIVRGQANLLTDVTAIEDLERIRLLFSDLEAQKDLIDLLSRTETAEGVRIFIGAESQRQSLASSSLVIAPFRDSGQKIIGMLGVIGPTRLNYGRIVPMVDYTAKLVSKILEGRG
jgi:heat-inducible transcriptional repressor